MCVVCGQSSTPSALVKKQKNKKGEVLTCDYTKEQAEGWQIKLLCIKNNNLFEQVGVTSPQMNGFLGVLTTIVKYNNNSCSFANTLEKIKDVIITIIGLGLCQ